MKICTHFVPVRVGCQAIEGKSNTAEFVHDLQRVFDVARPLFDAPVHFDIEYATRNCDISNLIGPVCTQKSGFRVIAVPHTCSLDHFRCHIQ